MNVVLLTLGTRGDVQPFVALGRRILARGHHVSLCTCQRFEEFITAHGLEYAYLDDDLLEFIDSDQVRGMIGADKNSIFQWIRMAIKMLPQIKDMQRKMLDDQWAACGDADVLIFHPKALGGAHIAEKLRIPAFCTPPFPGYVPTGDFPMFVLGSRSRGRWLNRKSYSITRRGQAAVAGLINEFRTQTLGLDRRPRFAIEPRELGGKPVPYMHPISEHVLPRPADWPDHATMTGYWFLDGSERWSPPEELQRFLAVGAPPVYIGFGSMVTRQPKQMAHVALEAIEKAGVRAILGRGWGGLQPGAVSEQVCLVEDVPHDWLLPRCSAVVHHGGAGSFAAGLRAGRPTLIVPHFADQPLWGARAEQLGVGPPPLSKKSFDAASLAGRITRMLDDPAMAQRAASIGEKLRAESGVDNAVEFMNRHGAGI